MINETNLRLPRVIEITGLSTSTIWRLEQEGKFPKRIRIGKRAIAWLSSDIQKWITSKK
jgi:prophage regulatory protein